MILSISSSLSGGLKTVIPNFSQTAVKRFDIMGCETTRLDRWEEMHEAATAVAMLSLSETQSD